MHTVFKNNAYFVGIEQLRIKFELCRSIYSKEQQCAIDSLFKQYLSQTSTYKKNSNVIKNCVKQSFNNFFHRSDKDDFPSWSQIDAPM